MMGMFDHVISTGRAQDFNCPVCKYSWVGDGGMIAGGMQTKDFENDVNIYVMTSHGLWLMEGFQAPRRSTLTGEASFLAQCRKCEGYVEFAVTMKDGTMVGLAPRYEKAPRTDVNASRGAPQPTCPGCGQKMWSWRLVPGSNVEEWFCGHGPSETK